MRTRLLYVLISILFTPATLANNTRNDLMSCYDYAGMNQYKTEDPNTELFIVVDQTVRLDVELKKAVHRQLPNFTRPGDKITIVTFSALAQGEYTSITFEGKFDHQINKELRNATSRTRVQKFDKCMENQKHAINLINQKLKHSFNDGDEAFPKTELVGSLLTVSTEIIAKSKAERKILLVVSDMLENSETLSFYHKGRVRTIDANKAFNTIKEAGFSGQLNGTEVHVIGAGFIHGAKNYSSQKSVNELEKFWRAIISDANGEIIQFGKPQLLSNIQ